MSAGSDMENWLGSFQSTNRSSYNTGPTTYSTYSSNPNDALINLGVNVAQKILPNPGTAPMTENSSSQTLPNSTSPLNTKWQHFKDRLNSQPETKWTIFILALLIVVGLGGIILVRIGLTRRAKQDIDRQELILQTLNNSGRITTEQGRVVLSPTQSNEAYIGTNEHLCNAFPTPMKEFLTDAVQGTGEDIVRDFEKATDITSSDLNDSERLGLLLACESRLQWMDKVAIPPLVKQLNGFDVTDMKLRTTSAIQDIVQSQKEVKHRIASKE